MLALTLFLHWAEYPTLIMLCQVTFGLIVELHSVGLLLSQALQVSSLFTLEIQVSHHP